MHTARTRFAAKLHPRNGIAYMHHSNARKQAAAQQTDRACVSGVLNSAINCLRRHTPVNLVPAVHTARAPLSQQSCTHASEMRTCTIATHENKPRHSKRIARAAQASIVLNSANCLRRHICESGASCARSMRPAEQQSCTRASESHIRNVAPLQNKPRHSKRIARAAQASVVLN